MGKLKELTEDEASDRLYWLRHQASFDLDQTIYQAYTPHGIDAKVIEKLHEFSRVAREVANYYATREPQVEWEIADDRMAKCLGCGSTGPISPCSWCQDAQASKQPPVGYEYV